jgi:molybdenum cofactor guanylyltransferase
MARNFPARALPITGLVLAGGEARRMGGADKGLAEFLGRPMVQRIVERLAPQVDQILISANRNTERYAALGHVVIGDEHEAHAGPLAGLYAAMKRSSFPVIAAVPCDAPFFPADLVARLCLPLVAGSADLSYVVSGGQAHRVFTVARRELLERLERYLASGARKVEGWHATLRAVAVRFEENTVAFANLNTPEQWRAAEQRAAEASGAGDPAPGRRSRPA